MIFGNKSKSNGAATDVQNDQPNPPTSTDETAVTPETRLSGDAPLDPKILAQIASVRSKVHESFGKIAMALMVLPRYRNLSIGDLNSVLLEPLIRDRVAMASHKPEETEGSPANNEPLIGIAIWASVSEEVDQRIREQIKAGVFPVRLKPEDWTSGDINWLMDVIAPTQKLTTSVIANFKQVIKEGDMRMHPIITRLVDPEVLKKMGAAPIQAGDDSAVASKGSAA
ncbi:hypothetical protein NBRC116602_00500 [Hyphomicrobiales bacterium 4NK60-0047b]